MNIKKNVKISTYKKKGDYKTKRTINISCSPGVKKVLNCVIFKKAMAEWWKNVKTTQCIHPFLKLLSGFHELLFFFVTSTPTSTHNFPTHIQVENTFFNNQKNHASKAFRLALLPACD